MPPPWPPFPPANDEVEVTTEPGLGLLALKAENARLRRERDEARALARGSLPPPGRGRAAKAIILTGQLAVLAPVIIVAARLVAKRWPETAELVEALIGAIGF